MDAPPPQLGQMGGINLGGYIPAPVDRTMKREVLYPLLAALGAKLAGAGVDKLTTPDAAEAMSPGGSGQIPQANWHQTPVNPQLAMQYKMQMPVSTATAGHLGAETSKIQAETPYVGPLAQSEIAQRGAGTRLTGAQTDRMLQMTPAELDQMRAETARTGAQTNRMLQMTPAELDQMRAETMRTDAQTGLLGSEQSAMDMKTPAEVEQIRAGVQESAARTGLYGAQGEEMRATMPGKMRRGAAETAALERENAAGMPEANAALKLAQTGDVASQTAQRAAGTAEAEASTGVKWNMLRMSRESEMINAYPKGRQQTAAKAAQDEYHRLHGYAPFNGDTDAYLQQMYQYISRRVQ